MVWKQTLRNRFIYKKFILKILFLQFSLERFTVLNESLSFPHAAHYSKRRLPNKICITSSSECVSLSCGNERNDELWLSAWEAGCREEGIIEKRVRQKTNVSSVNVGSKHLRIMCA